MPNASAAAPQPPIQLIGQSEAIRAIESDVDCASRSDAKVLITGETGVGKEVVARLIHQRSARNGAPLVTLNCAGLPDSLLESELFGHARGSFTGAYRDKPGLLEMGQSGTVFLDEVGEMSARLQVVLLRFLETGEIQRVGSERMHTRVNVRLITATNRDLPSQILSGAFREDLYFRLNVIRICIPPLRERTEDIVLLIDHFLSVYSAQHRLSRPELSANAMDALIGYPWPGNIRELKNVLERLVLRAGGHIITPADLPKDTFRSARPTAIAGGEPGIASNSSGFVPDELVARMLVHGESFWSAVYPAFMSRDMTRSDLRRIVHIGLENTNGNYRLLVQLFNMPSEDYKRFLSFLRKHDCHLPFQKFRIAPTRLGSDPLRPRGVRVDR
jgi:transcriptional regulator with GAF, ATPase, and Fis domain